MCAAQYHFMRVPMVGFVAAACFLGGQVSAQIKSSQVVIKISITREYLPSCPSDHVLPVLVSLCHACTSFTPLASRAPNMPGPNLLSGRGICDEENKNGRENQKQVSDSRGRHGDLPLV